MLRGSAEAPRTLLEGCGPSLESSSGPSAPYASRASEDPGPLMAPLATADPQHLLLQTILLLEVGDAVLLLAGPRGCTFEPLLPWKELVVRLIRGMLKCRRCFNASSN